MNLNDINALKTVNYNNTDFFSLNGTCTFCRIIDVLDGDTLTVIIPLHDNYYKFSIRLNGIDTCEIKSKNMQIHNKGLEAKNYMINLLCNSNNINVCDYTNFNKKELKEFFNQNFVIAYICCKEFDKFGRTLADVYLYSNDSNEKEQIHEKNSLSCILLKEKLAYPYFGETKMSDDEIIKYFDL